jgi:enolase
MFMSIKIKTIDAFEILDSRGLPTLRVTVELDDGHRGTASVPSGASTGAREAIELRDGDAARYRGKGVLNAISNVCTRIQPHLKGFEATHQAKIDEALIQLDGTENKSDSVPMPFSASPWQWPAPVPSPGTFPCTYISAVPPRADCLCQ